MRRYYALEIALLLVFAVIVQMADVPGMIVGLMVFAVLCWLHRKYNK